MPIPGIAFPLRFPVLSRRDAPVGSFPKMPDSVHPGVVAWPLGDEFGWDGDPMGKPNRLRHPYFFRKPPRAKGFRKGLIMGWVSGAMLTVN